MRLSSGFTRFSLFLLITAIVLSQHYSAAQDVPGEPVPQEPEKNLERNTDDATLNLHRWGAVTLFQGLPSDRVNAIAEDARGLMWFGTDNGLVRYDGRNVEPVAGEASLPSRRILALKLDARGSLWIGTDAGAARWREDRIEVLEEARNQTVTSIDASSQGEVAMVTSQGEILRYHERSDGQPHSESAAPAHLSVTKLSPGTHAVLKSPNQPNEALPLASIASFQKIGQTNEQIGGHPGGQTSGPNRPNEIGEWVIGSSGRGVLITQADDVHEATSKPPRPYFVASVFADAGRFWLGEQGERQAGGLWLLKGSVPVRQPVDTGGVTVISGGHSSADGTLWVGTIRRGVFLLKPEESADNPLRLIEHLTFENTAGGLRSNHINAIFHDREGVIWFGTDRGVCRYDSESFCATTVSTNSQSNYVRTMLQTNDGNVWAGTNRGLFKLLDEGVQVKAVEVNELQTRSVYDLLKDGAGAVWAATNSGLFVKVKTSATFARVASPPETAITIGEEAAAVETAQPGGAAGEAADLKSQISNSKPRESVRAIASFRGHIYAAYFARGIERIDGDKRMPVLTDAAAQRAICLAADADQALWFGTSEGELWRYDGSAPKKVEWQGQPSPDKQSGLEKSPNNKSEHAIRAIAIAGNRLWIGTSQGLFVREGEEFHKAIENVDVNDLLIRREPSGHEVIWCATKNAGLIKLLPDKNVSIRFDTEQGLASQQVFALAGRPQASQDDTAGDEIWIGTNRGMVRHRASTAQPRLIVKRLVAEKIYLPDELVAELALPHTLRSFLLEVTGLGSKTFPSQFQYEFSLQTRRGAELKKVQTRNPQFTAGDLQSGGYAIVVRAISRDLVYSEPLTIRVRIQSAPFPWGTLLLASLLAVAVIAAVWAFRQQLRLSKTNQRMAETNVELHETRLRLANETETERSRIARDLHDQTLADLRHLLVLTDQLPAKPNREAASDEDSSAPSPAEIRREIEAVSKEIRRICEDLSPSALENIGFLPALEWALSDAVAHLALEEKFAYEFICEPDLEDRLRLSQIEQIQLYRIVQEALNNTCRHARAKQVQLSVRAEKDNLLIEICDDGEGFDGQSMNKTGHGLANIRSRANLIGAQVSWQDAHPGCRFTVRKADAVRDPNNGQRPVEAIAGGGGSTSD